MWVIALILGFAGSMHCLGMCSPLAMAVTARSPFLVNAALYNLGRVLMYGVLGMVAATLGIFVHLTQYQNIFSLILGCFLVLMGLGSIPGVRIPLLTRWTVPLVHWIKMQFGFFLQKKSPHSIFILGALNGLLPCGLTYLAMSYCLTLDKPWHGLVFMILFGGGTLPVMLGISWVVARVADGLGLTFRKVSMTVVILLGLLLMARVYILDGHPAGHSVSKIGQEIPICEDKP